MANEAGTSKTDNNESMSDNKPPLFDGDELLGEGNVNTAAGSVGVPANQKDQMTNMSGGKDGASEVTDVPATATAGSEDGVDDGAVVGGDESEGDDESTGINESAFQELADQVSSLDDDSMMALVRGMPDESRQGLCAAVAGTLSDEQLQQCGLSKAGGSDSENMDMDGDGDGEGSPANDDAALQTSMANAKPEQMPGGMYMSVTGATAKVTDKSAAAKPHPHSLELADMKAKALLGRARAVHAKNAKAITADQLEQMEALLQGAKSLSLLEPDMGDLKSFGILVSMGERLTNDDDDADLLDVKTTNMSLTGDGVDGATAATTAGTPQPVSTKQKNSNGFDEKEATTHAEARWGKSKTTPAFA